MLEQTSKLRNILVLVVGLSMLTSGALAQGDRNRTDRGSTTRGDIRGNMRKDIRSDTKEVRRDSYRSNHRVSQYHYRDGRWYGRGWFGWEFVVSALAIGAFVEALPPHHTTIVVESVPYYYDDVVYYQQQSDGGYVVVAAPRGR